MYESTYLLANNSDQPFLTASGMFGTNTREKLFFKTRLQKPIVLVTPLELG